MTRAVVAVLIAAHIGVASAQAPPGSAVRFDTPPFDVAIGAHGVLVDAGAGIRPYEGERVVLQGACQEWYGVQFDTVSAAYAGCGAGAAPDWAARTPVRAIGRTRSDGAVTLTNVLGPLRIVTTVRRDPDGPHLLVAVTFTNNGPETVRHLIYTREYLDDEPGEGWTWPGELALDLPAPVPGLKRNAWMLDFIAPGASAAVGFSYVPLDHDASVGGNAGGAGATTPGVDVPLALWTNASFPAGLDVGYTFGLSWADFDADGWLDLLNASTGPLGDAGGRLWKNEGGKTWSFAGYLAKHLPWASWRYGCALADYDEDGYPDVATAPRDVGGYSCPHLLRNLAGTGLFTDVFASPFFLDVLPCELDAETICWGDVDGDRDLDLFVPAYPAWAELGGPGNAFFRNLGPGGVTGSPRFSLFTEPGGLENPPPDSARPEGAQFVDTDFDGDLDLYSNGTLYLNQSALGVPSFAAMTETGSGILYHDDLEEGCAFADYDMDGDQDLLIVYVSGTLGVRIFENRGDGTFFDVQSGVIASPFVGLGLGCGPEDWDNDGDMDFTTRQIFRRNMLIETGEARYEVATHAIPTSHLTAATPAWCDWDRDGDLDCGLANYNATGHFYENTLYDETTPDEARRFVRVRVVRDDEDHPNGLEVEFGASIVLQPRDEAGKPTDRPRARFVSSAAGYLTQNDYTLHVAVPGGDDVRFDLAVTFPAHVDEGLWRVDGHVNPVLENVAFASLASREITVFRSGAAIINGVRHEAVPGVSPRWRQPAALIMPSPDTALPADQPTTPKWIGIVVETMDAGGPIDVRELVIDGHAAPGVSCGVGDVVNTRLWDVTDFGDPFVVAGGATQVTTSQRNRRSYVPVDWRLEKGRRYAIVTRVDRLRASPFAGPIAESGLTVLGGILVADAASCDGEPVAIAPVDAATLYLTLRIVPVGLPTDIDQDGDVDFTDLLLVLAAWGPCPPPSAACPADVDGDGVVGFVDLLLVLEALS